MGSISKPILTPKPRRRDRRAGLRSEFVEDVRRRAASEWTSDAGRPVRSGSDRQASYARLLARYDRPTGAWTFRLTIAVVLSALVVLVARAALGSADLVALDDARGDYERLAALSASACQDGGTCEFGWGSAERPPTEVRALMPRVRARSVRHDTVLERTTIRGAYSADFVLQFSHRPARAQTFARREAAARRDSAGVWWTPPPVHDLGDGWKRIDAR